MRKLFIAAAALLLGFGFAMSPTAASAHDATVYHGSDWSKVASGHFSGSVKDRECDGNKVTALVWLKNGNTRSFAAGGCNDPIRSFSVGSAIKVQWTCEAGKCSGSLTHF